MRWFGKDWGAYVCQTTPRVNTPVGLPCACCGRHMEEADDGMLVPTAMNPFWFAPKPSGKARRKWNRFHRKEAALPVVRAPQGKEIAHVWVKTNTGQPHVAYHRKCFMQVVGIEDK